LACVGPVASQKSASSPRSAGSYFISDMEALRLSGQFADLPLPNAGRAFPQADRMLTQARNGPLWLKCPRIAALVANALQQGEREYRLYERYAWVIMPNHVHAVMQPFCPLPVVVRWVKGSSARQANTLARTGNPFWQYETYDHVIRNNDELNRVIRNLKESRSRRTCHKNRGLALVQCRSRPNGLLHRGPMGHQNVQSPGPGGSPAAGQKA
jgi:REP element-mobilizing transposase RayT